MRKLTLLTFITGVRECMFCVYADCFNYEKKNALCKVCQKVEKHRLYSSVCLDYEINSTLVTMYIRFFFEVQYEICNM